MKEIIQASCLHGMLHFRLPPLSASALNHKCRLSGALPSLALSISEPNIACRNCRTTAICNSSLLDDAASGKPFYQWFFDVTWDLLATYLVFDVSPLSIHIYFFSFSSLFGLVLWRFSANGGSSSWSFLTSEGEVRFIMLYCLEEAVTITALLIWDYSNGYSSFAIQNRAAEISPGLKGTSVFLVG